METARISRVIEEEFGRIKRSAGNRIGRVQVRHPEVAQPQAILWQD
jgi:hypothetical protein